MHRQRGRGEGAVCYIPSLQECWRIGKEYDMWGGQILWFYLFLYNPFHINFFILITLYSNTERIELFTEDHDFSPSYDGSSPTPSPPPPVSTLDRRHSGRLRKWDSLLTGWGVGGGVGAKPYDSKKAWSSINDSILSVAICCFIASHLWVGWREKTTVSVGWSISSMRWLSASTG